MMGIVYVMQMEAEEKRVGARNGFSPKSRRQPRVLPRLVGTSRDGPPRLGKCPSVPLEVISQGLKRMRRFAR
jgi:hypothetical protein